MAKAMTADAAAAPEEGKKGGKKKIIIIAVVVLLLLVGGGGAAAFFLLGADPAAEDAHAKPAVEEPTGPPVFEVLEPFVVNLAKPDDGRYLQIGITFELSSPVSGQAVKNFTPVIRSRILMVLSSKTAAELSSIEGKQRLMDELVDLARVTIAHDHAIAEAKLGPTSGVRDVHFSSFVIQ